MALECASCGSKENVDAVCHHCGRPLCRDRKNCRFEIEDSAFSSTGTSQVVAIHCRECWEASHHEAKPRRYGANP